MKKNKSVCISNIYKQYGNLLPPKIILFVALLLLLIDTGISLLIPYITMIVIDNVDITNIDYKLFFILGIFLLLSMVISVVSFIIIENVGETTVKKLRSKLWTKLLYLPVSFFDNSNIGDLMSRTTNDTQAIREFISSRLATFITSLITVVGTFAIMLTIDWKLAILLCTSVPMAVSVSILLGSKEYGISKLLQDTYASWQSDIYRTLSEIRLVKSSVAESTENKLGIQAIDNIKKLRMKEAKINAIINPLSQTLVILLLIINVGYGGLRINTGTLTTGAFVASLSYLFRLTQPVQEVLQFFTCYQKFLGSFQPLHKIFSVSDECVIDKPQITDSESISLDCSLCFSNVSFRYGKESQILNNISFETFKGQILGIVGPSGAGKTTIFSLIDRFYELTQGSIYYKGKNINNFNLFEWRRKIAYVFQDSPMMYGTVRYNLTYGTEKCTQEDIDNAIDNANLRMLIETLPQGINTEIGDKGVKLSGGERQRLAIARAMVRNPEILLLDEATSHLDSESEKLVQKSLDKLMVGRTTLVIAHRLSTVKNAAKIIVLENKTISGMGTHDELIRSNELYRKFVQQQIKR
ncbi:ABC transporter ATP-binding protein [Clostridium sp. E02]|uniref:ABC transporter ATP-binding protein n=1 Tax=Clostridium sp. E02 TaxID=2487134 RepID=UPI0013DE77FF|nr:ABC transporter ATP-binding protein [Clostridium sp. E02]